MSKPVSPHPDGTIVRGPHERAMRDALGAYATGVTIVTTRAPNGLAVGVTSNSFASVSLDPALILWSLAKSALSRRAFEEASAFAVHVLAAQQEDLARRFARSGADKFSGLDLSDGHGGVPVLAGAAATFECRRAVTHDGGDHVIFIGEVRRFTHAGHAPLVFHGGAYKSIVERP
jgi:3-hydroxy-9,10-secoandrosta-1,3,5(10)-triene-9,17-dione monooxygenase reductase component